MLAALRPLDDGAGAEVAEDEAPVEVAADAGGKAMRAGGGGGALDAELAEEAAEELLLLLLRPLLPALWPFSSRPERARRSRSQGRSLARCSLKVLPRRSARREREAAERPIVFLDLITMQFPKLVFRIDPTVWLN